MSYQQHPDGTLVYPNGVTLTHGIAAYVVAQHISASPLFAETYFLPAHSCVPFDDGSILSWDVAQARVRTDLAAQIVQELTEALAQAHLAAQSGTDDAQDDAAIAAAVATLQAAQANEPASGGALTMNSAGGALSVPATYVVNFGDTLEQIALTYYGDASRAADILVANGLITGDLCVGQPLTIPAPPTPDSPDALADTPILAADDGK